MIGFFVADMLIWLAVIALIQRTVGWKPAVIVGVTLLVVLAACFLLGFCLHLGIRP